MISVKNLMIGDFVICHLMANRISIGKIYQINDYKCMIQYTGSDSDPFHELAIMNEEYMDPIPLTDEILEKNGFVKGTNEWSGYRITNDLALIHTGKFRKHAYELVTDVAGGGLLTGIPINYVHDLQHFLNLCKIDKEIIL